MGSTGGLWGTMITGVLIVSVAYILLRGKNGQGQANSTSAGQIAGQVSSSYGQLVKTYAGN